MDPEERTFSHRAHLTKHQRLPRSYKEVEKILKDVKACKGNVKSLLNNSRLRGSVLKKVYALSVNVLRKRHLLDKIIQNTQLLEREQLLREDLAEILVYELIFGKGLPGESRPVAAVKKYRLKILDAYQEAIKFDSLSLEDLLTIPRYVRINTLRISVSDVVNNLTNAKYRHIQYGPETSEDEYLDLVRKLEPCSFLIDFHFKDLLVFSHFDNLTNWTMFKKNQIYIQDKSSYIPVFVLDPKPGCTVLDACAAPGMKTIHMASIMENKGKIYAFEKSETRFITLKDMLNRAPVKICEAECMDFYLVNTNDPKYNSVEYILVDPSCSGSGMVNRMDPVTDTKDSKTVSRLEKLAGFQILLLKHALSFPSVKRVVYSTCSMSIEENEYVIHEVLECFKRFFKLVRVMPNWSIRGSDKYKFGKFCLRANPEKTLTNGFFVAMFERMNSEEIQRLTRDEWFFKDKWTKKKKERKDKRFPNEDYNDSDVLSEAFGSCNTSDLEASTSASNNDSSSSSHHPSRKRKKVKCESRELTDSSQVSSHTNDHSSVSIITSENYSSDSSVKPSSTVFNNNTKEGVCSRKNAHLDGFIDNDGKKKRKESYSKKPERSFSNYVSTSEVCPLESSKVTSNNKKSNYVSSNLDELSKKKKIKQDVKEKHCNSEMQNEFKECDMNNSDMEVNFHLSNDNFHNSSKRHNYDVQDVPRQILSNDNRDLNVGIDDSSEVCAKTGFSHYLGEVDNLTNQWEDNQAEVNKEKKKKHKKKWHSEKQKIFNNPESEVKSPQNVEPQNTPEKKRKKKHYTSTESMDSSENMSETVSCVEDIRLKKKHKKKCKDKKSKDE